MSNKTFTIIEFREDEMILTDLTKGEALKILAETYAPKKLPFVKNNPIKTKH